MISIIRAIIIITMIIIMIIIIMIIMMLIIIIILIIIMYRHWQFLHALSRLLVHEISKTRFCSPTCFLLTATLTDVVSCGTIIMVKSNHTHHLLSSKHGTNRLWNANCCNPYNIRWKTMTWQGF